MPIYAYKRVQEHGFPSQRYDKFLNMTYKEPEDIEKKTEFVPRTVLLEEKKKNREREKEKAKKERDLRQRLIRGEISFKELRMMDDPNASKKDQSMLLGFLRDAVNTNDLTKAKRNSVSPGSRSQSYKGRTKKRNQPRKLLSTKDLRERRRRQNQPRPHTTPYGDKKNRIRGLKYSEASPDAKPHSHARLDTGPPLSYTASRQRARPHTSSASSLFSIGKTSSLKNSQQLSLKTSTSTLGGSSFLHNGNSIGGRPSTSPMVGTSNSSNMMDDLMSEFNRLPWGRRNIAIGQPIRRRGHGNSTYRISPSICSSPLSINLKNATSPLIDDKNREVIEGMIPPLRPDEFPVRTPNDFEVTSINL